MKFIVHAVAALALLCAAPATPAAAKKPPPRGTMAWLGFGVGILSGEVDLPCGPTGSGRDCHEDGLFPSYHANVTIAGSAALRLRAVRAEEQTRHRPREFAALVGGRLGRHWYGLVGIGTVKHADNEYPGDITGFAWEFLNARRDEDALGFEWSVHGNVAQDLHYVGVSMGFRLGDLR